MPSKQTPIFCRECGKRLEHSIRPHQWDMFTGLASYAEWAMCPRVHNTYYPRHDMWYKNPGDKVWHDLEEDM